MCIWESHICSSVRAQRSGPWSTVGVGFLGFALHCLKLYSWGFTFRIAVCARVCACYVYMCIYVNIYEHVYACLYIMYACRYLCAHMYIFKYICAFMSVFMMHAYVLCEYAYVCLWIWYLSICIYVNICIHWYIIYACIYTYVYMWKFMCVHV